MDKIGIDADTATIVGKVKTADSEESSYEYTCKHRKQAVKMLWLELELPGLSTAPKCMNCSS